MAILTSKNIGDIGETNCIIAILRTPEINMKFNDFNFGESWISLLFDSIRC